MDIFIFIKKGSVFCWSTSLRLLVILPSQAVHCLRKDKYWSTGIWTTAWSAPSCFTVSISCAAMYHPDEPVVLGAFRVAHVSAFLPRLCFSHMQLEFYLVPRSLMNTDSTAHYHRMYTIFRMSRLWFISSRWCSGV